jgi:hypothetical protein
MSNEPKTTFAEDIENAVGDEPILGVVIGASRTGYSWDDDESTHKANVVLTWDEARPTLDYTYHRGYGGANCHPVTVWTETKVLFVHEYDGSTGLHYLPRHLVDHKPEHSGRSVYSDAWDRGDVA